MQLLIDEDSRSCVRSLWDPRLPSLPDIEAADSLPLEITTLKRVNQLFSSRIFAPKDLTGASFRVAIGGTLAPPVAGNLFLTFIASDNSTETTAAISYWPTAEEIEEALNAGAKLTAAGGVSVTGAEGFFVVTFNVAGTRNLISGDPTDLVPLSLIDIRHAIAGNTTTKAVQTIRILQNAGAATLMNTVGQAASIALNVLQAGGSGQNTKLEVTITGAIYKGSWTFTKTGPGGTVTSQSIAFDDTEAQIQSKIANMAGIGAGNVLVTQQDDGVYDIEFVGSLAGVAVTGPSVNGSALVALPSITGVLDLTVPGVDYLLDGEQEKVVNLEVEKLVGTNPPLKILQHALVLRRPVIEAATSIPTSTFDYYTKEQIDALTGDSADITVSAAGTHDLAPAAPFMQWFQKIVAQAGSGPYTHKFTLDNSQAKDGAIFRVYIELAASANPTIEIRDDLVTGTLLQTLSGDSSNAGYFFFEAEFDKNSNTWRKIQGGYLT